MGRIRWGRVAFALGAPPLAWSAAALAALGVVAGTAPAPVPPGARAGEVACGTGEALGRLAERAVPDGPLGDADRAAAAALLDATRCASVTPVPGHRSFQVWLRARRALDWIAENERPDVAVDHLLDVWELAADQRRAGSFAEVWVLSAVGEQAAGLLRARAPALRDPEARARLAALAEDRVDWRAAATWEEAAMWSLAAEAPVAALPDLLDAGVRARMVAPPPAAVELEANARALAVELARG